MAPLCKEGRKPHNGLTSTEGEALALFLLGEEIGARYAGNDAYDIAGNEGTGVCIPETTFRALLDWDYLESAASTEAMSQ